MPCSLPQVCRKFESLPAVPAHALHLYCCCCCGCTGDYSTHRMFNSSPTPPPPVHTHPYSSTLFSLLSSLSLSLFLFLSSPPHLFVRASAVKVSRRGLFGRGIASERSVSITWCLHIFVTASPAPPSKTRFPRDNPTQLADLRSSRLSTIDPIA